MVRSIGGRLSDLLRMMRSLLEHADTEAEQTRAALTVLEAAVVEEFGSAPRGDRRPQPKARLRRVQQALWYQRKARQDLQLRMDEIERTRVSGALRLEWLARVALAPPDVPPKVLRQCLEEVLPESCSMISDTSISRIRDAFVELLKEMSAERVRSLASVAACAADARRAEPSRAASSAGSSWHVYHSNDNANARAAA